MHSETEGEAVVGAGVVGAGVVGAGVVGAGVADDDEEAGVVLGTKLVVLRALLLHAVTTAVPAMTAATTIFLIHTGYSKLITSCNLRGMRDLNPRETRISTALAVQRHRPLGERPLLYC
jgi:hypothetical protein